MKIIRVSVENVAKYIAYCHRYGAEQDESYLPDDTFTPTDDYPGYLIFERDEAVGAAGLMRTRPYREKGKARLTIFHTTKPSPSTYALLLGAIHQHTDDLGEIYGFLPESQIEARQCWENIGFVVERYAYLLVYRSSDVPIISVPDGYNLAALTQDDDVGIRQLCDLWNQNYGQTPGFVGVTPEEFQSFFNSKEHVPEGELLLMYGDRPVATVQVSRDDVEPKSADVGMLSVHPEYRGQGLGRLMLRKAISVAFRNDLKSVYLSVNAENETAVGMYMSEGFTKDTVMVCYTLALRPC